MKYLLKITLGLIVCMAAMASCNDDDHDGITGLSVDKEDITIGAEGGTDAVVVSSEGEWYASASEPWVTISPANGIGGATECTVVIDSTMSNLVRKAEIRLSLKGQATKLLTVHQTGYGKMISIEKPEIEIAASAALDKRYFEAIVTTNVAFKIEAEYANSANVNWVILPEKTTVDLDRGYRPRTAKIRFEWNMNPDFDQRVVKINFVPQNAEDELEAPAVLTITQKASPRIEDNRAGDSLALLTIKERMGATSTWDPSENMRNWEDVVLWERTDGDKLPSEAAIGRVRSVVFNQFNTKESVPQEVHYLTYVESLTFFSNVNNMLKNVNLGNDFCELKYLKELEVSAYGLISLPDDLIKLGSTLEVLNLYGNNFTNIPAILTKENFPKLKSLSLAGNRRWTLSDLRDANKAQYTDGIGFHFMANESEALKALLLWDNLESLSFSYNYMEGTVPDFKIGDYAGDRIITGYAAEDLVALGDTAKWLYNEEMGRTIPKILPKMKHLAINLNFFTGKLPDWILYHPYLIEWDPEMLVFNQNEKGIDSSGKVVGFSNTPKTFDYYYNVYKGYREKYELQEEIK